jgi:hypothetical protein
MTQQKCPGRSEKSSNNKVITGPMIASGRSYTDIEAEIAEAALRRIIQAKQVVSNILGLVKSRYIGGTPNCAFA